MTSTRYVGNSLAIQRLHSSFLGDTFRNTISLSHLIQHDAHESQIRSLIDVWRHQGYMPDVSSMPMRDGLFPADRIIGSVWQ